MWTLGTLIWMPIFMLLMLIGVVLLVITHIVQTNDRTTMASERRPYYDYDPNPYRVFRAIVAGVMVILLIGTAWGMFPYKAEYHRWETKDGVVSRIDKRIVGSGDGMQEKFVVTLGESSQQYGCLDTRCASIRQGDYLDLACKKDFEYGATDGWDCKFRSWEDRTP